MEIRKGPPLGPFARGFRTEPEPVGAPAPPVATPPVYAPEIHRGPPLGPFALGFTTEPQGQPKPPRPPTPARPQNKPFVPRVPDIADRRAARHTEIVAAIFNSLLGQGILVQTGPESYTINPAAGGPGLTGTFNAGKFP